MKRTAEDMYLPAQADIIEVTDLTPDIRLFKVKPDRPFRYKPGEFIMLSLWGKGEVPLSITSAYGTHRHVELCIRRIGYITTAINELKPGSKIGIRGPFGTSFPIAHARGRDVLFIAGGLGIAPLRPLITQIVNEKRKFKNIALVYGSRTPGEILFRDDLDAWEKRGAQLILTVDKKDGQWQGNVGLVTEYLTIPKISFTTASAFLCGPPVMITGTMNALSALGMPEENIFTSLEAHMKCGIGKCGHCYVDGKYICTDGPVFSFAEIKKSRFFAR